MLVFDRDELVAWAEVYRGRGEADVRPSHRGRGIGAACWRGSKAGRGQLGDPEVGQTKTDANAGAARAVPRERLPAEVDLVDDPDRRWTRPPPPPEPAAGHPIRPYRQADARDVHRVIDAAFTEWRGRDPEPYEVWASTDPAHPAFRPELSPLAFDGDELVGAVIAYDYPELGEGWIQQLATKADPPAPRDRRRRCSGPRSAGSTRRGRRVAGVSTDSRTGALGLYEKVGMRVVRQYTRYTKHLS